MKALRSGRGAGQVDGQEVRRGLAADVELAGLVAIVRDDDDALGTDCAALMASRAALGCSITKSSST